MRTPIIAGNWKMHHSIKETKDFFNEFNANFKNKNNVEIIISPPYINLSIALTLAKEPIKIASQNAFYEDKGAYTGEISLKMLKDSGINHVILGHSERRHIFGETNEVINKKLLKSLELNMIPILCIGEKLDEREAEITEKVINHQLEEGLKNTKNLNLENIVIAYEPVWAIGTGKNAKAEDAKIAAKLIRHKLSKLFNESIANKIRILYGGSVKPENIAEYMRLEDIDGALVGGASLKPESFLKIINYN